MMSDTTAYVRCTSRRLEAAALEAAPCSAFWYCYNDGRTGPTPRHAWLHCRFELDGLNSAEARALREEMSRGHIFARFDLTRVGAQEHWSETDPSSARFTECLRGPHPGGRRRARTRGEIRALVAAAWDELPTYADAGVDFDGSWAAGCCSLLNMAWPWSRSSSTCGGPPQLQRPARWLRATPWQLPGHKRRVSPFGCRRPAAGTYWRGRFDACPNSPRRDAVTVSPSHFTPRLVHRVRRSTLVPVVQVQRAAVPGRSQQLRDLRTSLLPPPLRWRRRGSQVLMPDGRPGEAGRGRGRGRRCPDGKERASRFVQCAVARPSTLAPEDMLTRGVNISEGSTPQIMYPRVNTPNHVFSPNISGPSGVRLRLALPLRLCLRLPRSPTPSPSPPPSV